jgi:hypothetical protein
LAAAVSPEELITTILISSFDMRARQSCANVLGTRPQASHAQEKPWCFCITASIGHAETAGPLFPENFAGICAASALAVRV